MDLINNLMVGFGAAMTLHNLGFALIGCVMGTAVGILPGLGPAATVAMLLPLTFALDPLTAMIMLAGIYYGAQYGGSTTAILVNLPGESSSVVAAIDGHKLARNGRAGVALATAAIGSFVAGTIATLVIAAFAPALSSLGLRFGAPEFCAIMVLGLVASIVLASGSIGKALTMVVVGLIIGTVGIDLTSGVERFTFGHFELAEGLNIAAITMGLFGLSEVMRNLAGDSNNRAGAAQIGRLIPNLAELKAITVPILRGTGIGSFLGILPGGGALLSSFVAYAVEKKVSPNRKNFGHGALEGLAAPEAANNAGAQTSFIPMLTLGIPSNAIMAMMIGALMVQGISPGPATITQEPVLFWGLIASMWIGNLMLLILNLPLVGMWVKLLSIPYRWLFPSVIIFCGIGAYSLSNNVFEVLLVAGFGLFGYVVQRLGYELTPLVMAAVIGPLFEENLRRALLLSEGDPMIFIERPISLAMLLLAACAIILVSLPMLSRKREEVFVEE